MLPLVAMGAWAAGSALVAMASKALASQDEADVARLRAEHQKMIYEAVNNGVDRATAVQQADAALRDAITQAEEDVNSQGAGDYAAAGLTAGALGAAGGPLLGKGIGKAATWAAGKMAAKAAPAAANAGAQASSVAARGVVPVGPVTPAQNMGTGFIGAGRMRPSGMASAGPSYGNVPRTYDVVPEGTPQLGYQGGANPMQLGYNPSRLPPSALSAEEAALVRNLGMPNVPGPSSPFTPPGAGMPPMMVQNMMAQGEADAIRAAAAARQAAWKRRLGTITGD